jgi:hypothetical protein
LNKKSIGVIYPPILFYSVTSDGSDKYSSAKKEYSSSVSATNSSLLGNVEESGNH